MNERFGRTLLAAASFFTVSCGSVGHKAFVSPANGGAPWTEVQSAHFVVTTDLDRESAERASADLEAMFSALSDSAFPSADKPKMKVRVVYFQHEEEYKAVAPKLSAGVLKTRRSYDFESQSIAVLYGDLVDRRRATLQHELTHFFVGYYYPQAPTWLNEGLAVYHETLDVRDGVATLGRLSLGERFWKGPWNHECDPKGCTALVPLSEAVSASALVKMNSDQFYGHMEADITTAAGQAAYRVMAAHYASAFGLMHLFEQDPSYKATFDAYMSRLRSGEPDDAAWASTVGALPADKLDADFRDSLVRHEVMVQRTKYAPTPTPPESIRTLSDGEVHALWAWLWNWATPEGRTAAASELNSVPPSMRETVDFTLLRAYWLHANGASPEAERLLRTALEKRPNDARFLNALGWVVYEMNRAKHAPARAIEEALAPIAASLAPNASTSTAFDLLARYSAAKGALQASLAYDKKALTKDPDCVRCLSFLARTLNEQGHVEEALVVATEAQGLLRDGVRSAAISEQVRLYRRRLSAPHPFTFAPEDPSE